MRRVSGPNELVKTIDETVERVTDDCVEGGPDGPGISGFLAIEFADRVVTIHDDHVAVFPTDWIQLADAPSSIGDATTTLTAGAFEHALKYLVQVAHVSGVEVRGSWSLRTRSNLPDWDVEITEVTKPIDGR